MRIPVTPEVADLRAELDAMDTRHMWPHTREVHKESLRMLRRLEAQDKLVYVRKTTTNPWLMKLCHDKIGEIVDQRRVERS